MKKQKVKIERLQVKSFITNSPKSFQSKNAGNDGGYTWVG